MPLGTVVAGTPPPSSQVAHPGSSSKYIHRVIRSRSCVARSGGPGQEPGRRSRSSPSSWTDLPAVIRDQRVTRFRTIMLRETVMMSWS